MATLAVGVAAGLLHLVLVCLQVLLRRPVFPLDHAAAYRLERGHQRRHTVVRSTHLQGLLRTEADHARVFLKV